MRTKAARWVATVGSIGVLLFTACADEPANPEVPTATVPTAAATTATTNPFAVPAVIDVAYVNRVLAWLDQAEGDIFRSIMSSRTVAPDDVARLRALHANDGTFQVTLDAIQFDLRSGFSGTLPNPGNTKTVVTDLLSTKGSCIYAKVDRDYSAVARTPNSSLRTQWVALRRLEPSAQNAYNTTGWGYLMNGGAFGAKPSAPAADPCATY